MYFLHDRGSDIVTYVFNERKFENKMRNLIKYGNPSNILNSINYKRKQKPHRILAFFRYRNRDPLNKKKWVYFQTAHWIDEKPFTAYRLLSSVGEYAEDSHTSFQLMGSDSVQLKEISLLYIYENKETKQPEWISKKI